MLGPLRLFSGGPHHTLVQSLARHDVGLLQLWTL